MEAPRKRFQSYRGTWAWLIQRVSAVALFLLIPVKIYTGWAADDRVFYCWCRSCDWTGTVVQVDRHIGHEAEG